MMESDSDRDNDRRKSTDLTSPNFDALRALYSRKVPLLRPDAPILDNITKFVNEDGYIKIKAVNTGKPKVRDEEPLQPSTSRFLPHQEPVARVRRVRDARTVLTRMNSVKGPLAMLTRCMELRVRLKVMTRNMAGVRGHCLGFLVAFDKHFNLAMEDVTEVWTRRRRPKTAPHTGVPEDVDVPIPRVSILERTAKTETCERHLKQLLMRGEHVVLISATDF